MIKSVKIRLLPNQEQEALLWKTINASRFIWNWGLAFEKQYYKNTQKYISGYSLKKEMTKLKQQEDTKWLNEVSRQVLANTILDLDNAFKRSFKKITKYPKFKSKKKAEPKCPIRTNGVYFKNNCVNIEKIGKLQYQTNYNMPIGRDQKFYNARIKYINNKWILSLGIECENQAQDLNNYSMGIDLGIKDLAIISYDNDKVLKFNNINKSKRVKNLKHKLRHLQRKVSRKYETNNKNKNYNKKWTKSNNIIKTEKQIKDIHCKLSNIRKNCIHQCTAELIKLLPKRVIMEDLNITGMMKNRHLSKAIAEQCLSEFMRQMQYKCEYNGIEFVQVDRFYPSSKTCSECGCIKKDLKLSDRIYKCKHCGNVIDRDINAAKNLEKYIG